MAKNIQHDDFGEKIGGARKDLWQQRGLLSGDLDEMNDREAEKYVKKDCVWKKVNYQAMIDSGIPVDVVYFIKTVRDSLATGPTYLRTDNTPEKRLARQKQYVDTVREIQGMMENVKTKADALAVFERGMIEEYGYFERMEPGPSKAYYATITEKGRENPAITNNLAHTLFFKSEIHYEQRITYEAKNKQFGISKEQIIPKGFEVLFNDGKHTYSKDNDWKPDTYYVVKGHQILIQNLATRDDALKWIQDYAQGRGKSSGKKRFVPPQLENIQRDGPDYRHGKNIDGQDYLDTYGFRGGEYGNWMTQNDRQASLNYGYDALKDLADALKITDKDISYQGVLSIAFGARGGGKFVAHYEPLRKVINITKMRGAGSLAHEWWHGLDDFLGQKMGANGYLSENPRKYELFKKLIDTIKYKPETTEQAAQRTVRQDSVTGRSAEKWLEYAVYDSVKRTGDEKILNEYERLKAYFLSGEKGSVDKLNELKKSVSGHIIPKKERETLLFYERALSRADEKPEIVIGTVITDYYKNSKNMGKQYDKEGGYWDSNTELTARAFATYIMDKLAGRSDYLCGHAECAVNFTTDKDGKLAILKAYPEGEERKAINAVFDEIVADLKLQRFFTHDEKALPQIEEKPQETRSHIRPVDMQDFGVNTQGEQLTFGFFDPPEKPAAGKPSVLGQIASNLALVKASSITPKEARSPEH